MFLNYQIDYLLLLQHFREASNDMLTPFFCAITHFGAYLIPILFIALVYWCLNKKAGEFLIINFVFIYAFNQFLKMIFCIERPWILSDKIKPVADAIPHATGYSFPSGHTACATAVWGGLAVWLWENKISRYGLITLILLIAFSRNYLGVHTPQDVLVSLFFGIIILFITNKVFKKSDADEKINLKVFIAAVVFSLVTVLVVIIKPFLLGSKAALISFNSQVPNFYLNMGLILGSALGWYLCKKYVNFGTEGITALKRILRYALGVGLFFLISICTKEIFISDFGLVKGNFFYGACVSSYVTLFYPWIFTKIEKVFDVDKINAIWKKD